MPRNSSRGTATQGKLLLILMGDWLLTMRRGHFSAAQALADQVLESAERDARAQSLVLGHLAQGITRCHRGDWLPARGHLEQAGELIQLATEHQLPHFLGWGLIMGGWALVDQRQCDEGIAQLRRGIEIMRTIQQPLTLARALGLLADAEARSGAIGEARAVPEEGFTALSEELFHEAALVHLRGELLAREGSPEAGTSFREAISIARRQGAKM